MKLQLIPGYERLPVDLLYGSLTRERLTTLAARLASAGAAAWTRIAAQDRATIIAFWDRLYATTNGGSPRLQLWPSELYDWPQESPAYCLPGGAGIYLDADRLFAFPSESWIALVIAEELAHTFLYCTLDPTHAGAAPTDLAAFRKWDGDREAAAQATLSRWGFDMGQHRACLEWGIRTKWGTRPDKAGA